VIDMFRSCVPDILHGSDYAVGGGLRAGTQGPL